MALEKLRHFDILLSMNLQTVSLVVCCFALLTTVSCVKKPVLEPIGTEGLILAFGDSVTAGSGASPDESYPAQLEKLIGRHVINAGTGGETSSEGLSRLPALLQERQASLIIICYGGNDFLHQKKEEEVKLNIRSMIEIARNNNLQVVLIGVPRPGLILKDAKLYEELGREFSIPNLKGALSKILSEPSLKADQVHPNADGYKTLAQKIAALLVQTGALEAGAFK